MTLLAPLFLAGLLAIGLPLWLHRLSSENPNRQRFSSLMFLEPGEPRRVLAKRLQYLLLLALRIALLVLLALTFAQPALWRSPQAAPSGEGELHLIVLDRSASMAYGDRWDEAQDAARAVIADLGADDRGQVVAAGRVMEVLTDVTADAAVLRQAVDATEPGVFRIDYGQLTRSLDGLLRATELPVVLHVITDAQQSSLPTRFADLAPRTPAELRVHNVAPEPARNWAVDSFGGSALTGELAAGIRSFATEDAEKTVRLELNGDVVDERRVSVPAGGRADVTFAALELREGANRVTVTLAPGDDLPADDARYLALKRAEPRPVLVVSGDARGLGALYAGAALETLGALALMPETIGPADLAGRSLGDYSFVVVTDAGVLGTAEGAALAQYVQSGGALLMAFGPRSTSLNAVPVTGQALRPAAAPGGGSLGIGAVERSHPALRGLEEPRAARFQRYAVPTLGADDRALLSLDDGSPLLVESGGAGRVLLLMSSLDREWNDLPVQPAFVPLMGGIANYLLGGEGFSSEAELGSTLAVRALGFRGGQIFDPQGEPALRLGAGSEDVLLDQIGFYEVAGGGATELVAVNFDVRESDLTGIDAQTLERWQALGQPAAERPAETAAAGAPDDAVAVPLGPWLLILLLLAVVVESWVGNWHLRVRRGIAA
ncbi:MAG TPA: BatA domain-containing protein [Gammaproteobacteria bacterium]